MSDSEDDQPLVQRAAQTKQATVAAEGDESEDDKPLTARARNNKRVSYVESGSEGGAQSSGDAADSDADSDDDAPLAKRIKKASPPKRKGAAKKASPAKKRKVSANGSGRKAKDEESGGKEDDSLKWTTLRHCGVLFPPEYQPHGIKMLYDGKPVDLTPDQEEVASMFAVMKETDYMSKQTFLTNFWEGFKEVLGRNHVIKGLAKCDFTPMYEYFMAQREAKKGMSKEVGRAGGLIACLLRRAKVRSDLKTQLTCIAILICVTLHICLARHGACSSCCTHFALAHQRQS